MPDNNTPRGPSLIGPWFDEFLRMPNDSTKKTIMVALMLCLACSILVSTAAVVLKPLQASNKLYDRNRNIVQVAGLMKPGKSVEELMEKVEPRVVQLETGEYTDAVDPATYDQRKAAKDPAMSEDLPPEKDTAKINRQADYATVYLIKEGDKLTRLVLPVHGYGLWSTLYGFLALEPDTETIYGISFYDHAETPGLGGEVDNPNWKALWKGKLAYDEQGEPAIDILKGKVGPDTPQPEHKVDGLSGATLTSVGVENLIRFWLGPDGFGPYLEKLRAQRG